jgi:hypothetical protein
MLQHGTIISHAKEVTTHERQLQQLSPDMKTFLLLIDIYFPSLVVVVALANSV